MFFQKRLGLLLLFACCLVLPGSKVDAAESCAQYTPPNGQLAANYTLLTIETLPVNKRCGAQEVKIVKRDQNGEKIERCLNRQSCSDANDVLCVQRNTSGYEETRCANYTGP